MDISFNPINQVTLKYMVNNEHFSKYLKNNHLHTDTQFKKDKKFYRHRIISLTKDLFKNNHEDNSVNNTFHSYIISCITFFKFKDRSEFIQKEYNDLQLDKDKNYDDDNNDNDSDELIILNTLENDKQFIKENTEKKILTLDNFVIKKNENKPNIILPQAKEINLKDPIYKYKDGRPKKKKDA